MPLPIAGCSLSKYVCYILNHISTASLGGQVPLQVLYGVTPDISIIVLYTFYQPVFYATHDQHFPSDSEERAGFCVGFAEHCGDSLTHMVLDAVTPKDPNIGLLVLEGRKIISLTKIPTKHPTTVPIGEKSAPSDTPTVHINSRHDDGPTSSKPLPGFNPDDIVGRAFLLPPGDNGERLRAKVTRKVVEDIEEADGERVQKLSFILGIGNGKLEEIISYNQLVDHLQQMMTKRSVMICSSLESSLATRDPSSQQTPIGKDASIMSLLIGRLGRRLMNPSQSWLQMIL